MRRVSLLDTFERRSHEVANAIAPEVLAAVQPYQAYTSARMAAQLLEQARQHVHLVGSRAEAEEVAHPAGRARGPAARVPLRHSHREVQQLLRFCPATGPICARERPRSGSGGRASRPSATG